MLPLAQQLQSNSPWFLFLPFSDDSWYLFKPQSVATPHSNSTPSAPLSSFKKRSVLSGILNILEHTPAGWRKTKAVGGARVSTSIEVCQSSVGREET